MAIIKQICDDIARVHLEMEKLAKNLGLLIEKKVEPDDRA